MDQDQGVGHEVKRLREERGWSQAKLAVEADMSVSGVSMIENGQRNLTTTTLAKLARAFRLEIVDLFPKVLAPLQLELEEQSGASGERHNLEDVWKEEYLARAGEMLDKWEDELEDKLALAESDLVRFFDWLEEVREFGHPLMMGVVSGYAATSSYRLEAIASAAVFLDPWDDLWLRIEERLKQTTTLSKEDEKRFRELYEKARAVQ